MQYIDAIKKLSQDVIPRLDEDSYYRPPNEYESIVFTLSNLYGRSTKEVRNDLGNFTRLYRDQKK